MLSIIFSSLILNIIFTILATKKIEPMHTFFYPIAWYTFIVFISAVNSLKSTPKLQLEFSIFKKNFIKVAFVSVSLWLFFELFNLRIKNWAYHGVPSNILVLHIFGFLCFSTVLPGIFNVADFFEKSFCLKHKAIGVKENTLRVMTIAGTVSLLLLIAFPKVFFPLLWLSFIFLLEPLNYYIFKKTVIFSEIHKVLPLMLSGFICGLLWEFWNFFSGARWVYTLPWEFLMKLKLFHMPVPGYFGFPVFAIEAYQIYRFIENIIQSCKYKLLLGAIYISFCLISFNLTITYTVISFK